MIRFKIEDSDLEAINKLHPRHRDVLLTVKYFDGHKNSYENAAQALNVPLGTIKSRTHRARKALETLRRDA